MAKLKFSYIKYDDAEITKMLKSEPVEELLMELGEKIVRDVRTVDKDGVYEAQLWRERKTRSAVNVRSIGEGAFFREAINGYLASRANKKRGL